MKNIEYKYGDIGKERWPSGLRRSPAKRECRLIGDTAGSNPALSA
jgi:hypothetical protein